MLGVMLLSRPKPPWAGAEGQPLQGYSSQRQLTPKVSGPPLATVSTPRLRAESTAWRAKFTHSKFKRAIIHRASPRQSGGDCSKRSHPDRGRDPMYDED